MKKKQKALVSQLAIFTGLIATAYAISNLLPKLLILSSVSWNLGLF